MSAAVVASDGGQLFIGPAGIRQAVVACSPTILQRYRSPHRGDGQQWATASARPRPRGLRRIGRPGNLAGLRGKGEPVAEAARRSMARPPSAARCRR